MQPDATAAEVVEGELVDEEEEHRAELALPPTTLFRTSDPRVALERMAEVAKQVANVIDSQRLYARISGKKYVTCPGWKTAGGMLGLAPYTVWTRPNESGDGYVARVEIRTLDERTIAAAEAECARDESNWSNRPKHAVRSMAETRATSRAFRGPLEQIFVLAGFEPTAAEEMPVDTAERSEARSPVEPVGPSREQWEQIRKLIGTLEQIEPDVDWKQRSGELAGQSAPLLTKTGAAILIDKLRGELAARMHE